MILLWGQQIKLAWLPQKDRRQNPRIPVHETLYLSLKVPEASQNMAAEGKDISASGVLFATDAPLPEGTILNLSFHFYPAFGDEENVDIKGRVIRCFRKSDQKHYRIGCVFENLDQKAVLKIRAFTGWLKEWNKNHSFRIKKLIPPS